MLLTLTIVMIFSNIIFFIGIFGLIFLIKSNFFLIISIETMVIAININFLFHSIYLNSVTGILFNFYIITLSAIEMVVILSFLIVYFKKLNMVDLTEKFNLLKN